MKKIYLTILIVIAYSYCDFAQNTDLSVKDEINKIKIESFNNNTSVEQSTSIDEQFSIGSKSVQVDFGNPPQWDWVSIFGGSGKDNARDIITSEDGSIFMTGSFSGEISVETNTYTSIGRRDAFLAKFQENGSLLWFQQFSALPGEEIDAYGIHADEAGSIYFTGYFSGDVSFGDINLVGTHTKNLFLAVANPQGEITMATDHPTFYQEELGIVVDTDSEGNIFVLGSTDGTTFFRHPSVLIKYTSEGSVIQEYPNSQNFCDMAVVGENIYFTGTVFSPAYIGNFYLEPMGYNDAFIAKSNTNFNFEWVEMGNHTAPFSGDSYGIAMHISSEEDVFLLGYFRNEVIWGTIEVDGIGGFITKCSSDGEFLWATNTSDGQSDDPVDITGNIDNVFVTTNYPNEGLLWVYNSLNGEMVNETNFDNQVESLYYSTIDNSVILSQDVDQLISLSKLDDSSLITEWGLLFGGNSAWAHGIGMAVDQFGYQFNFGYVSNQMDYFGQTINKGLFLARQNTTGNPLWIVQFADADDMNNTVGSYTVVDTNTNSVYVAGKFYNPLVIPGGPTLVPDPYGSIYLLKYDYYGNFQWAVQEDFFSFTLGLATDNSGNVILSGTFSGTVTIGGSNLVSAGGDDAFIVKYNDIGEVVWARRAGGETIEYWAFISTDGQDNVYMTGEFVSEDVTVDDYAITMEEGDGNVLLSKFDSDGNVLWVTVNGGSTVNIYADHYGWPTGIHVDYEGNSYIKGWCNDSAHFDDILLTSSFNIPDYNNRWNKFVAKFDSDGNTIWATSISEVKSSMDYNQFDVDQGGNVYTGLRVRDITKFGNDFTYTINGNNNLLVVNYSNDGELNWVKSIEDSESGSTWISSVAVIDEETTYVCGWFTDYLNFGNVDFEVSNKTGFIGLMGELTGSTEYERDDELLFEVFPVPAQNEFSILFTDKSHDKAYLSITDISGRNIYAVEVSKQSLKKTIDISGFSPGVYFVTLKSEDSTGVRKLVVN